eukprot:6180666-Pleurochrysis_carterae.AAC.1
MGTARTYGEIVAGSHNGSFVDGRSTYPFARHNIGDFTLLGVHLTLPLCMFALRSRSECGRGGWSAPARGLQIGGASRPRLPCASGDMKPEERSACASQKRMRCIFNLGNHAYEQ